jgi:DNA polymerase I-like protein with 3'-5' exonuclease and polymerase domains
MCLKDAKASSISPNYTLLCQLLLIVGKKEEEAHDSYLLLRMKFKNKSPKNHLRCHYRTSSLPLYIFLFEMESEGVRVACKNKTF